ncbi:hypothetical protein EXN66_Car005956 [Channa argus]|uniref:Sperm microtubule inner protein 1 C-terminal domain-containing protein n=1 Tax=Channa argus TaxID=215402 RepID=A0A6G1PJH3_CHAAH|nr:hypothetical protein EXN66_Car005956 [Channa argus]
MRNLLTTQSQNCYREQIQKEMLTRLAWRSQYAKLYPSCSKPQNHSREPSQLPPLPADPRQAVGFTSQLPLEGCSLTKSPVYAILHRSVLPPVKKTPEKQSSLPPPPPHVRSAEEEERLDVACTMRPVSPKTRQALYQDSSHHGKGRRLYLQTRGRIRPEEKFGFPLLSSWEYGWRLGKTEM